MKIQIQILIQKNNASTNANTNTNTNINTNANTNATAKKKGNQPSPSYQRHHATPTNAMSQANAIVVDIHTTGCPQHKDATVRCKVNFTVE